MKSVYLRFINDKTFLVPEEFIYLFDKILSDIDEEPYNMKLQEHFVKTYYKYRVNDIKSIKLYIEN